MRGEGHLSPLPYKALDLKPSGIRRTVAIDGAVVTLSLSSESLALFVVPECGEEGHFSDSAFALLPGEVKQVTFTAKDAQAAGRAAASLIIRDLHSSFSTNTAETLRSI